MVKKNLSNLILALMVSSSAIIGNFVHIDKRIVMLLGILALLAWVAFLSFMLLVKTGPKSSRGLPK